MCLARILHLDEDLSGPRTGDTAAIRCRCRPAGADPGAWAWPDTQVVAYDDAGGMFAARAWWLLRWLGHEAVAVLDGGVQGPGRPLAGAGCHHPARGHGGFLAPDAGGHAERRSTAGRLLAAPTLRLIDARAANRFAGQDETLDPVGGHIPGARNRFFS